MDRAELRDLRPLVILVVLLEGGRLLAGTVAALAPHALHPRRALGLLGGPRLALDDRRVAPGLPVSRDVARDALRVLRVVLLGIHAGLLLLLRLVLRLERLEGLRHRGLLPRGVLLVVALLAGLRSLVADLVLVIRGGWGGRRRRDGDRGLPAGGPRRNPRDAQHDRRGQFHESSDYGNGTNGAPMGAPVRAWYADWRRFTA